MSFCPIHQIQYRIEEVKEYPGKTLEVCPVCQKEKSDKMACLFGPPPDYTQPPFSQLNTERNLLMAAFKEAMDILDGQWNLITPNVLKIRDAWQVIATAYDRCGGIR